VATPTGQRPVWQRWAWMQPMDSIASRATETMSQPSAKAHSAVSGRPSLPDPMKTTSSVMPARANAAYTREKPILNGSATWSVKASGPAPVPPSPPSTVTKSTPRPVSAMRPASSSQNASSPTADLMPTGRPVASASISTKSIRPSTSEKAEWPGGLTQSRPASTPRICAMVGVTLAAGSIPPRPGLAPCDSLISSARTGAPSSVRRRCSRLKCPASSRQPKYPVPIWNTSSPPWRWCSDSPPSPVPCMHPARTAPSLSARIAAPESAPKLMPETFTTDAGRKACRRPRAAPRTFGAAIA